MGEESESKHRPIFRIDSKLLEEKIKYGMEEYQSLSILLGYKSKDYEAISGTPWAYNFRAMRAVIGAYDTITNAFINPESIRYYPELKNDIEELRRFNFLLEENRETRRSFLFKLLDLNNKHIITPRENIKRIFQYFPLLVTEVRNLYPKEFEELPLPFPPPNQESKQEQEIEPKETVIPVEAKRKDTETIKKLEEVKETLSSLKYTSEATCLKLKNLSPKLREFGAEDLESTSWRLVFDIEDNVSPSRSLHEDDLTLYRKKVLKFLDDVKNRLEQYEEAYFKATKNIN